MSEFYDSRTILPFVGIAFPKKLPLRTWGRQHIDELSNQRANISSQRKKNPNQVLNAWATKSWAKTTTNRIRFWPSNKTSLQYLYTRTGVSVYLHMCISLHRYVGLSMHWCTGIAALLSWHCQETHQWIQEGMHQNINESVHAASMTEASNDSMNQLVLGWPGLWTCSDCHRSYVDATMFLFFYINKVSYQSISGLHVHVKQWDCEHIVGCEKDGDALGQNQ